MGDAIGVETRTGDHLARDDVTLGRADNDVRAPLIECSDRPPGVDGRSPIAEFPSDGKGDPPEVDDPGLRAPQALDPGRFGLDLEDPLRSHLLEARHTIGDGAITKRCQAPQLALVKGDDELAASLERDSMPLRELLDKRLALTA